MILTKEDLKVGDLYEYIGFGGKPYHVYMIIEVYDKPKDIDLSSGRYTYSRQAFGRMKRIYLRGEPKEIIDIDLYFMQPYEMTE